MPGEGERGREGGRREGDENPGEDPFEKYAEELEKYEKARGHEERDQAASSPDVVPRPGESPSEAKGETGVDEFEAYAKELEEMYAKEERGFEAPLSGQNDPQEPRGTAGELEHTETGTKSSEAGDPRSESVETSETGKADLDKNDAKQKDPDIVSGERVSDGAPASSDQGRPSEDGKNPTEVQAAPMEAKADLLVVAGGRRRQGESPGVEPSRENPRKDMGPYEEKRTIQANMTEADYRKQDQGQNAGSLAGEKAKNPLNQSGAGDIRPENGSANTKSADFREAEKRSSEGHGIQEPASKLPTQAPPNETSGGQERPRGLPIVAHDAAGRPASGVQVDARRTEKVGSFDSTDYMATFSARATRTGGENSFPVFNIMRTWIEEQVGTKMNNGGLYHVVGTVEGIYDFDVYRTVKNYVRLMVPLEHRDEVRFGEVYRIHLKLVEEVSLNDRQREILAKSPTLQYRPLIYRLKHAGEGRPWHQSVLKETGRIPNVEKTGEPTIIQRLENIDATFTLKAYLHTRRDQTRYFTLPNAAFEQKTGLKLEEMRDYIIKGEIQGVGEFRKNLLRCAARQDVPIYCSSKLSKSIEVGKEYAIKVDSIEKLVRPKPWEGIKLEELRPWSWKEVASWVDTEGAICCRNEKGGNYQILISQKERKVLAEIAYFLDQQGLRSYLRLSKATGVYNLHIEGAEIAARVIKEIEPHIRTENKIIQISDFKKSICRPRKTLWPSIKDAREILGVTNRTS